MFVSIRMSNFLLVKNICENVFFNDLTDAGYVVAGSERNYQKTKMCYFVKILSVARDEKTKIGS